MLVLKDVLGPRLEPGSSGGGRVPTRQVPSICSNNRFSRKVKQWSMVILRVFIFLQKV